MGLSPRQCHALLWLLLSGQPEAQLSYSRHPSGSYSMHRFRRGPTRQQNCIYRLSGVLHYSHICILRSGHWTTPIHRPKERPTRPLLVGFSRLCHQCCLSAADHLLQHYVLLPSVNHAHYHPLPPDHLLTVFPQHTYTQPLNQP